MFSNGRMTQMRKTRRRTSAALTLALVAALAAAVPLATSPAFARGGQSADDCPPGNKDPDCSTH